MTRAQATPAKTRRQQALRLPALEIRQGPNRRIYTFAIDGKHVGDIAAVARIRRDNQTRLHGYQRPESLAHVAAIRRYLDTDPSPLLPNAVVIAFDERVRFQADKNTGEGPAFVRPGTLIIPVVDEDDPDKPGFIVDGQQRSAAIRDAKLEEFPICVTAFIADTHADQRSQFILVNSTKALPKGLIHELLPEASGALPAPLMVRQLPATLVERLNFSKTSPLHRMIQTPTNPNGLVKDNSVLRMLENSLSDGALYPYRGDNAGPNFGCMIAVLDNFWTAVAEVFPDAWNKPPRRSRLMHGAGIISMGYLMDAIAHQRATADEIVEVSEFAADLKAIADDCHWTEGVWPFDDGDRAWNDLQNTTRDIQRLTDYLLAKYRSVTSSKRHNSRRARRTT
ncbi:DGQHR domain-containing protein [Dactylosporangium roseum]|uniref:DGQHR domain-containing protein n=1 Tax=Dactylosporangium roseum TaxID=47989 RepID=A0ABY5Z2Z2_9ACTN|nr:DGQHR domain-containing protein DpdB [Dactylosporangium roseum]UWZ36396.1 DGQHR domain-containing protein [Dactylosporangium roseum]